jgi:hypothetical protein
MNTQELIDFAYKVHNLHFEDQSKTFLEHAQEEADKYINVN